MIHEHSLNNDVNNQQDATTFSFNNVFKSAQHVSGDKFTHPQEHLRLWRVFYSILINVADIHSDHIY
jgi:hypothetical protein